MLWLLVAVDADGNAALAVTIDVGDRYDLYNRDDFPAVPFEMPAR